MKKVVLIAVFINLIVVISLKSLCASELEPLIKRFKIESVMQKMAISSIATKLDINKLNAKMGNPAKEEIKYKNNQNIIADLETLKLEPKNKEFKVEFDMIKKYQKELKELFGLLSFAGDDEIIFLDAPMKFGVPIRFLQYKEKTTLVIHYIGILTTFNTLRTTPKSTAKKVIEENILSVLNSINGSDSFN